MSLIYQIVVFVLWLVRATCWRFYNYHQNQFDSRMEQRKTLTRKVNETKRDVAENAWCVQELGKIRAKEKTSQSLADKWDKKHDKALKNHDVVSNWKGRRIPYMLGLFDAHLFFVLGRNLDQVLEYVGMDGSNETVMSIVQFFTN